MVLNCTQLRLQAYPQREGIHEERQRVAAHVGVGGGEAAEEDGLVQLQEHGVHAFMGA